VILVYTGQPVENNTAYARYSYSKVLVSNAWIITSKYKLYAERETYILFLKLLYLYFINL
jgi:hypothetical protein